MYDIAIVGAGPAGSTLARLLGQRYKILLIDPRPLSEEAAGRGQGKCCGGLLAPDAQKIMATMGLGLPAQVLVGPQLFVVRAIDLVRNSERFYQRFYINIDREKFDRWLVSLIPDRVATHFGAAVGRYDRKDASFTLHLQQGVKKWQAEAKFLVAADGANSLLRKQASGKPRLSRQYIAIQEWSLVDKAMPYFTALFDNRLSDFYGWTIPKGNHLLTGLALRPGPGAAKSFQAFKNRLTSYGLALGVPTKREGAFIVRPNWAHSLAVADGIAFIGEAGGWISPSSAEGLSYAFASALAAAKALHDLADEPLAAYAKATRRLRLKILAKNIKSPAMYHPTLRCLAMGSGLLSVRMQPSVGRKLL